MAYWCMDYGSVVLCHSSIVSMMHKQENHLLSSRHNSIIAETEKETEKEREKAKTRLERTGKNCNGRNGLEKPPVGSLRHHGVSPHGHDVDDHQDHLCSSSSSPHSRSPVTSARASPSPKNRWTHQTRTTHLPVCSSQTQSAFCFPFPILLSDISQSDLSQLTGPRGRECVG